MICASGNDHDWARCLAQSFSSNSPSENFVSVRSEKFNAIQRIFAKKSTQNAPIFHTKACLWSCLARLHWKLVRFSSEKFSEFFGHGSRKRRWYYEENGSCRLRVKWHSLFLVKPGQRIISESAEGQWKHWIGSSEKVGVFFMVRSVFGVFFCALIGTFSISVHSLHFMVCAPLRQCVCGLKRHTGSFIL